MQTQTKETQPLGSVSERAQAAVTKLREGRADLSELTRAYGPKQVLDGILEGLTIPAPNNGTSNLQRVPRDLSQIVEGRPSLPWAIKIVVQEDGKGEALSTDDIYAGLESRGWLPSKSRDPRPYVSRVLSGDTAFIRDTSRGRGFYKLAPGVVVPSLVELDSEAANGQQEEIPKTEIFPRVIQVLQRAKQEISIRDIVKATGADPKSIQGPLMVLIQKGALKKTRKTTEEGRPLFSVHQKALTKYLEERG